MLPIQSLVSKVIKVQILKKQVPGFQLKFVGLYSGSQKYCM
jgi:hypothetical protein